MGRLRVSLAGVVVPLLDARRLIAHEQRRREDDLGRTIDAVVSQLRDRAGRAVLAGVGELKSTLDRRELTADIGKPIPRHAGGTQSAPLRRPAELVSWRS